MKLEKMNRIYFRKKLEFVLGFSFLVLIIIVPISVCQTPSDPYASYGSFIRNTKGNYWNCTGVNVQNAIWNLNDTEGGTVYVDGDITLISELRFGSSESEVTDVIVDFQKNTVILDGDISFFNMTATRYCTVKNVRVLVTDGHTESVIKLYIPPEGSWEMRVRYNTFENIHIQNPSHWTSGVGWDEHNYTGIQLELGGSNFLYNTFRDIQMEGVGVGIHLKAGKNVASYGNGNLFENIWIDQFVTAVWFDVSPDAPWGFNENVFQHVKAQTASYSLDGFKNISHCGNHFYACLCWDWDCAVSGNYDWSIANNAYHTYICPHGIKDLRDDGVGTKIITYGISYDYSFLAIVALLTVMIIVAIVVIKRKY